MTLKRPGPVSTLGEVRVQLIEAGLELLTVRGVDIGLDAVGLSDAISAAGVSRSTAYRSLADEELSPQAVLRQDVQRAMLTRHNGPAMGVAILEAVQSDLERHGSLDDLDVSERTRVMRSIIRVGANASYDGVINSTERAVLTSLYGALQSSPSSDEDWRLDAVKAGERHLTGELTELYAALMTLFDYRTKPNCTLEQLTVAGAALVEGLAMRHNLNDHGGAVDLPTGPDGAPESWSLFAIAFEKLVVGLLEPADSENPYADLLNF